MRHRGAGVVPDESADDFVRQVAAGEIALRDAKRTVARHGLVQHARRDIEKLARETDLKRAGAGRHVERKLFARQKCGGRHVGRQDDGTGKLQHGPIGDSAAVFKQFDGKHLQIAIERGRGHGY